MKRYEPREVALGFAFLPPGLSTRLEEGQPVVAGVRPERLAHGGGISARLDAVEWLGHERLLFCRCGDQPLLVRRLGVSADGEGEALTLGVDPAHVQLFDPTTTQRLS